MDVVHIIKSMKDPQNDFEVNNMSKYLSDKEKISKIKKSILAQKINLYLNQYQKL